MILDYITLQTGSNKYTSTAETLDIDRKGKIKTFLNKTPLPNPFSLTLRRKTKFHQYLI